MWQTKCLTLLNSLDFVSLPFTVIVINRISIASKNKTWLAIMLNHQWKKIVNKLLLHLPIRIMERVFEKLLKLMKRKSPYLSILRWKEAKVKGFSEFVERIQRLTHKLSWIQFELVAHIPFQLDSVNKVFSYIYSHKISKAFTLKYVVFLFFVAIIFNIQINRANNKHL